MTNQTPQPTYIDRDAQIAHNVDFGTRNFLNFTLTFCALCWLPALIIGPGQFFKDTWKVGVPVTGTVLLMKSLNKVASNPKFYASQEVEN